MTGLVTLRNRLPEIQARLAGPEFEAVLTAATETVAETARMRVPVLTGELKASIDVKPVEGEGVGIFMAWYGSLVEHGTVNTPAHPFLVPAAEAGKATVPAAIDIWLREIM